MPRRRERVAPPPRSGGWDIRFANNDAAKGWEQVSASAPSNVRSAWERITDEPRRWDGRQKPLQGPLASASIGGAEMEQWQLEVTSGGRIWYCIDDAKRTLWVTRAGPCHPKSTD